MAANSLNARVNVTTSNTTALKLEVHASESKLIFILTASVCFVLALIGIFCAVFFKLRKERKYRKELAVVDTLPTEDPVPTATDPLMLQDFVRDRPPDEQAPELPLYCERFEIPWGNIRLGGTIGSGNFGKVVKGEARIDQQWTAVAVKICAPKQNVMEAAKKEFIKEIQVMIDIGRHRNIVNILGAVTIDYEKGPCMILEYCEHGSLRSYLQRHKPEERFLSSVDENGNPKRISKVEMELLKRQMQQALKESDRQEALMESTTERQEALPGSDHHVLTTDDLYYFAFQISKGMAYLSKKSFIHRDLAARNILVADHDTVKIADFGLSRPERNGLYVVQQHNRSQAIELPVWWLAPESLQKMEFSSKSDVWSYGVLLWEIFSLGNGLPYSGIRVTPQFTRSLANGTLRLERAEFAPTSMFEIMRDCLNIVPKDRPDFNSLSSRLEAYLDRSLLHYYAEISVAYEEYNANLRAEQHEYYLNNDHFGAGMQ